MRPPSLAIDPFDEAFLADPYAHHAALRDAGPVVWLEPLGAYGMAHQTFCSSRGVGLADFAKEEQFRPPPSCSKPIRRFTIARAG